MSMTPELWGLLAPALFAGLLVSMIHVPLGLEVLRRGIIFIDLAVAQMAALGVVAAKLLWPDIYEDWPLFLCGLIFALLASGFFWLIECKSARSQEAFIGSTFVIAASLSILLLAGNPHGGEEMQDLLAGQILWVGWPDLILTAIVFITLLSIWVFLKSKRSALFYIVFPVTITLSVQLVGVYLVFASLIIPALGAQIYKAENRIIMAYGISVLAVLLGLILSVSFDLPTGPAIVCTYPLAAVLGYSLKKNTNSQENTEGKKNQE